MCARLNSECCYLEKTCVRVIWAAFWFWLAVLWGLFALELLELRQRLCNGALVLAIVVAAILFIVKNANRPTRVDKLRATIVRGSRSMREHHRA